MSETRRGIRCKLCDAVIVSRSRHDMRWCPCGAVAIDGGRSYTRILGSPNDYEIVEVPNEEPSK